MRNKLHLAVFGIAFLISITAFADEVYRTVTASDSATANVALSDQRGVGKTTVQVNPYGGGSGAAVATNQTPYLNFDLFFCHDATSTSSACTDPTYSFRGQVVNSQGWVSTDISAYSFVGVRVNSMTIAGTGTPAWRFFVKNQKP